MDPLSQITIRTLIRYLADLARDDLKVYRTETLSALLRVLLQGAKYVSDELDRRASL